MNTISSSNRDAIFNIQNPNLKNNKPFSSTTSNESNFGNNKDKSTANEKAILIEENNAALPIFNRNLFISSSTKNYDNNKGSLNKQLKKSFATDNQNVNETIIICDPDKKINSNVNSTNSNNEINSLINTKKSLSVKTNLLDLEILNNDHFNPINNKVFQNENEIIKQNSTVGYNIINQGNVINSNLIPINSNSIAKNPNSLSNNTNIINNNSTLNQSNQKNTKPLAKTSSNDINSDTMLINNLYRLLDKKKEKEKISNNKIINNTSLSNNFSNHLLNNISNNNFSYNHASMNNGNNVFSKDDSHNSKNIFEGLTSNKNKNNFILERSNGLMNNNSFLIIDSRKNENNINLNSTSDLLDSICSDNIKNTVLEHISPFESNVENQMKNIGLNNINADITKEDKGKKDNEEEENNNFIKNIDEEIFGFNSEDELYQIPNTGEEKSNPNDDIFDNDNEGKESILSLFNGRKYQEKNDFSPQNVKPIEIIGSTNYKNIGFNETGKSSALINDSIDPDKECISNHDNHHNDEKVGNKNICQMNKINNEDHQFKTRPIEKSKNNINKTTSIKSKTIASYAGTNSNDKLSYEKLRIKNLDFVSNSITNNSEKKNKENKSKIITDCKDTTKNQSNLTLSLVNNNSMSTNFDLRRNFSDKVYFNDEESTKRLNNVITNDFSWNRELNDNIHNSYRPIEKNNNKIDTIEEVVISRENINNENSINKYITKEKIRDFNKEEISKLKIFPLKKMNENCNTNNFSNSPIDNYKYEKDMKTKNSLIHSKEIFIGNENSNGINNNNSNHHKNSKVINTTNMINCKKNKIKNFVNNNISKESPSNSNSKYLEENDEFNELFKSSDDDFNEKNENQDSNDFSFENTQQNKIKEKEISLTTQQKKNSMKIKLNLDLATVELNPNFTEVNFDHENNYDENQTEDEIECHNEYNNEEEIQEKFQENFKENEDEEEDNNFMDLDYYNDTNDDLIKGEISKKNYPEKSTIITIPNDIFHEAINSNFNMKNLMINETNIKENIPQIQNNDENLPMQNIVIKQIPNDNNNILRGDYITNNHGSNDSHNITYKQKNLPQIMLDNQNPDSSNTKPSDLINNGIL